MSTMAVFNIFHRLWRDGSDEAGLPAPARSCDSAFGDLSVALPGFLQWEWDEQTQGALALMEIDAGDKVLEVLADHFEHNWNRKTLRKAPSSINAAVKTFGGVQANQRVLAMVLSSDLVLLGLWWPWGHGGTISIRLVPYTLGSDDTGLEPGRSRLKRALRIQ